MWIGNWFKKKNVYIVFSHEYVGIPTTDIHQTFDILKYKKIRDSLVEQKYLKRNLPQVGVTREYLK